MRLLASGSGWRVGGWMGGCIWVGCGWEGEFVPGPMGKFVAGWAGVRK